MTSATPSGVMTAILPCNNLDVSERFYNRLGFARPDTERPASREADTYRILSNGKGGYLHLTDAVEGWLVPGRNPFGLYLYVEDVDALAAELKMKSLRADRRTSPGECTNSPFPTRTKRWFASAGQPAFADSTEPVFKNVSIKIGNAAVCC
jgi:hypothetical protein